MSRRLVLYSKADCPLCDEAAPVVRRLAAEFGMAVEQVDIEEDAVLRERYQHLVPVVAVDGEALLYPPISEPRLREALRRRLKAVWQSPADRGRENHPSRGGV